MNTENEIIKGILSNFRKSTQHKNEFFHSDSEIIALGGRDYLFTMDTYSDEDHFRLNNPYNLGINLAVCTLSDIFACGGKPLFFCNSLNCEHSWDQNYINLLAKGISDVLNKCGTAFIGGDFGYCPDWNFTGAVIGEAKRIVTRKGASPGDLIYLTGEIGGGNFEAASVLANPQGRFDDLFTDNPILFPLRIKEAGLVSDYATSCIDTSDGLFKSLQIISEINQCGFEISGIPYLKAGTNWAERIGLPRECLMFGECGEYELMFTVNPHDEQKLLSGAVRKGCKLYNIGKITDGLSQVLNNVTNRMCLNDFDIYARDYNDHKEYIASLTKYLISKGSQ